MFPILRFRHHDVRERRSSATVDDVRARDTVFDQFVRHRARVGVDAEFGVARSGAGARRRGESIGDVSTADDVERAGAMLPSGSGNASPSSLAMKSTPAAKPRIGGR